MRERYETAPRLTKSRLLDEVCEVTGYHRKAVIRLLRRPAGRRRGRRGRPVRYGPVVVGTLWRIWEAAGYPWSVRLQALLPIWLPWACRRWRIPREVAERLQTMSPRQMDRCLRPFKSELRKRQYGRTKPGTLLKHQIPLKTDRWDVEVPGADVGSASEVSRKRTPETPGLSRREPAGAALRGRKLSTGASGALSLARLARCRSRTQRP